jgi:ADP-heptose:LPS heptosyltransferase
MKPWRYYLLDAMARRVLRPQALRGGTVVYSPGHIGDILHSVPLLKRLRERRPDKQIVWLVGPWGEGLARRYEKTVAEIVVFASDYPNYWRQHRAWRQSAWTQWGTGRRLNRMGAEGFVSTIPEDGACRYLANAICPKIWSGVGDRPPPRVRKDVRTAFQPYQRDRYEADSQAGLLSALGIDGPPIDRLAYSVTGPEREQASDFLARQGIQSDRPLALLAPGSGWSGKNWLPERFGEIADWLVREKGCQVAWTGTAAEKGLIPESRNRDWIWMGKMSLELLAAVIERARIWVGNDSGPLHLAAAVDTATVSIWGPTSPARWGPKGPRHRQVRKWERCPGCICWDWRTKCIRERHECMLAIDVNEVIAAIESAWSGKLKHSAGEA